MNNLAKNKIIQEFNKEISEYEKEYKIQFSDDTKIKLADSYTLTLLTEKDIDVNSWIEENIADILNTYNDGIVLMKGE